jgi:phosphinothricin acetyltransferase
MVTIRDAGPHDAEAIAALANALVDTTTYTWSTEPEPVADLAARLHLDDPDMHPTLVADAGGVVVGWTGYGGYRDDPRTPGYAATVELTIHVDEAWWGHGVGRQLMEALIERARADGKHVLVAAIDGANVASQQFHERMGFVEVGRQPEVGRKWGRWLDLVLMQRVVDR